MKRKHAAVGLLLLAPLLLLSVSPAVASEETPRFGPWNTVANLGQTVNSSANDQRPTISKDGLSLYFGSERPGPFGAVADLWVAQRDSIRSPWGPPQNLGSPINTPYFENAPSFSPDGHWMYFGSDRPGGCGSNDLYVSHRKNKKDDFGWETPINLGCGINSATIDDGATFFSDDNGTGQYYLYFTSLRPGGLGDYDIYVSRIADDHMTAGAPALVQELNSPDRDTRTTIRKDGLEILYTSARPGGLGGFDVWMSTRASTAAPWSTPTALPAPINTSGNEGAPSISHDGTTLFFDSVSAGGFGGRDIVVATREKR